MNVDFKKTIARFANLKVLVIGDAILDSYITGTARRLCQEAPVPVADDCRREDYPGGAANVASNLRALGARPILLAPVGNDCEGDLLRRQLSDRNVSASDLIRAIDRKTLAKHRVYCGSQLLLRFDQGTTTDIRGAVEARFAERLEDEFSKCDAVIVSDYGYGTMTPFIIDRLAQLQATTRRVVALDSKSPAKYRHLGVTLIKPNFSNALAVLNESQESVQDRPAWVVSQKARLLMQTGADIVAVTLDRDGVIVLTRGGQTHRICVEPAPETRTAGAGDTFISAMTLALAAGSAIPSAAEIAAKAAAVVVAKEATATCNIDELMRSLEPRRIAAGFDDIARVVAEHRRKGRRIVLTNGCFDIIHRGHINYLGQAKRLGDVLIVGVNTDESIRRLKGPTRPVNSLDDRLGVLAGLSDVDSVVPFGEDTPHRLIEVIRPDVFVKGGDYTRDTLPEADLVERLGGRIVILPFLASRSTTNIIDRIRGGQTRTIDPRQGGGHELVCAPLERCG